MNSKLIHEDTSQCLSINSCELHFALLFLYHFEGLMVLSHLLSLLCRPFVFKCNRVVMSLAFLEAWVQALELSKLLGFIEAFGLFSGLFDT